MKAFWILLLVLAAWPWKAQSQQNVYLTLTGDVVGTWNAETDELVPDRVAVMRYLNEAYGQEGSVVSWTMGKENGYGYLVAALAYTNKEGEKALKWVAVPLAPEQPDARFKQGDCVEHSCDGGCGGGILTVCNSCAFVKENGKITGCKCNDFGYCCHKIRTVEPCPGVKN